MNLQWLLLAVIVAYLSAGGHGALDSRKYDSSNDVTKIKLTGSLERRLPKSIIIGVRKGGTRALLVFLSLHAEIVTAREEVHFFDVDSNYKRGLEYYRSLMPLSRQDQVTIEKSPAYFITSQAPLRIKQMDPNVKLILLFRDPVTRTISDYTQVATNRLRKNRTVPRFEDVAMKDGEVNTQYKPIRISIYHEHMAQWLRMFNSSQLHIVDGDKLISNPMPELRKIEQFLRLPTGIADDSVTYSSSRGFYCVKVSGEERCLSASKGRKHPKVDPSVVLKLKTFFKPHNEILFKMIGRRFDW